MRGDDLAGLGRSAAEELARNITHGGCVDEYLQVRYLYSTLDSYSREAQDQIIIFLALAKGKSTVRTGPPTLHTKYVQILHTAMQATY